MASTMSTARARFLRGSPQKFRLVVDQIRGRQVPEALGLLQLSRKRASKALETLLRSAVANAENLQIDPGRIGAFGYSAGAHLVSLLAVLESDAQSPWARHELIIDGTRDEPRSVYYRDIRRLGRGFEYRELSRLEEASDDESINQTQSGLAASAPR